MPEQRTDPLWRDDIEFPPEHPAPRRQCIVSRHALRCGKLIAALETAVSRDDEIEIIRDRRRGGDATAAQAAPTGQPSIDRRRLPYVDSRVKLDGFAIVPLLTGDPGDTDPSGNSKWPAPRLPNPPLERRPAVRHSVADTHSVADPDEDERELERILQFKRGQFKRGQKVRVGSWLILAALVTAIFVLFLQLPTLKTLMTRTDPAGSPSAEQTSESPRASQTPAVDEARSSLAQTSAPPAETSASPPPIGGAESPESAPSRDTGAERQAATGTIARVSPGRAGRASSSSIANVRAPDAARRDGPRFPGLPRVELIRNSVPTAEGKADAYVVRVSDTSGRPLTGADVLLLIRMDDGTVENMTLRAGPEPGTYQGTALHSRSSPVDLRLRMMVKDSRVEIPLSP
jgi:hypothetical protein